MAWRLPLSCCRIVRRLISFNSCLFFPFEQASPWNISGNDIDMMINGDVKQSLTSSLEESRKLCSIQENIPKDHCRICKNLCNMSRQSASNSGTFQFHASSMFAGAYTYVVSYSLDIYCTHLHMEYTWLADKITCYSQWTWPKWVVPYRLWRFSH